MKCPCESGQVTGVPCDHEASAHALWMPPWRRESHRAAGYSAVTIWDADAGAEHLELCEACADMLGESEREWLLVTVRP